MTRNLKARPAPKAALPFSARELLDSAADMIWIRELEEGRLLEVNDAAVRGLGVARSELLGRPVHDFYYSERDRKAGREFARRIAERGSALMTATFRDVSGGPMEIEMHGSLLETAGRKAALVIARRLGDLSREHRRALTLYEGFKRSNDVMFYCDRNGVILDVNEAFVQHYGYKRAEVLGKTPAILRSRHSTDELYRRMWAGILDPAKGFWRGEIINRTKDGREIPLILTITAVRDAAGQVVGYVSNAVDMTEHVALLSRVSQSEALATLGEMAAVIAHEIRNPLGSIVMASKQLAAGQLSKADREMVFEVLKTESQRLNATLSNFLTYARSREIKHERTDLNALVAEVWNIVKADKALLKGVRTAVHLDAALKSFPLDPDQIRQVVWNIVLNALQALEGKGRLEISTGREKGFAFIRVRDTGPGIAEDRLPRLFKPFQTSKQQGTGLGLAIAERIVKAHGGRIEVDSRAGCGASFTVHLPWVEG